MVIAKLWDREPFRAMWKPSSPANIKGLRSFWINQKPNTVPCLPMPALRRILLVLCRTLESDNEALKAIYRRRIRCQAATTVASLGQRGPIGSIPEPSRDRASDEISRNMLNENIVLWI